MLRVGGHLPCRVGSGVSRSAGVGQASGEETAGRIIVFGCGAWVYGDLVFERVSSGSDGNLRTRHNAVLGIGVAGTAMSSVL